MQVPPRSVGWSSDQYQETLQGRRIHHTILYCPLICIIFYSFYIPLLLYLHTENYCMSPAHFWYILLYKYFFRKKILSFWLHLYDSVFLTPLNHLVDLHCKADIRNPLSLLAHECSRFLLFTHYHTEFFIKSNSVTQNLINPLIF